MKPLIVLLGSFVIALLTIKILHKGFDFALAGSIAMSVMLLFTSIGHFAFTKGMRLMIPAFIPFKTAIVYLTGVFEILAAAGVLVPSFRVLTGWTLVVFFILLLPANINAALHKVDHEKGTHTGKGVSYLWFRVPLQVFFIIWVLVFVCF